MLITLSFGQVARLEALSHSDIIGAQYDDAIKIFNATLRDGCIEHFAFDDENTHIILNGCPVERNKFQKGGK